MNLPAVSLGFNTKSQESSVTHQRLSVNGSAAANLLPAMTPFHCAQGRTKPGQQTPQTGSTDSAYQFVLAITCEWGSP